MFCTSSKSVAVVGVSETDRDIWSSRGEGEEVRGAGRMKTSISHDVRRHATYNYDLTQMYNIDYVHTCMYIIDCVLYQPSWSITVHYCDVVHSAYTTSAVEQESTCVSYGNQTGHLFCTDLSLTRQLSVFTLLLDVCISVACFSFSLL